MNFNLIILKLSRMGFDNAILSFFASYVTDRQQQAVIFWNKSGFRPITNVRPQGSIIAVILFFRIYKQLTQHICKSVPSICGWHINDQPCGQKKCRWKILLNILLSEARKRVFSSALINLKKCNIPYAKSKHRKLASSRQWKFLTKKTLQRAGRSFFSGNLSPDYHLSFALLDCLLEACTSKAINSKWTKP